MRVHSILYFFAAISAGTANRLSPCDSSGYQDVVENTVFTLTCDQYSTAIVTWRYTRPAENANPITLGRCHASHCEPSAYNPITLTFIDSSSSRLTSTLTSRSLAGGQYICDAETCRSHIIVPAEVNKPTTPNITRTKTGYSMSCSADITQVYSSRGLYSCDWQVGTTSQTVTPSLQPTPNDTTNLANRTGRCDITLLMPTTDGNYVCTVTVSPGDTHQSSDSRQITRPSQPVWTCPSDYIPENTQFSCTCTTSNIGQPGGRLRWYTGTNSNVSTDVVTGNFDVTSLTMTYTVTKDDNNRKFRCVNKWAEDISSQTDYVTMVSYGPATSSIVGDTMLYTDSAGSQNLTLTCQTTGVNPTFALTFSWNVPCDASTQQETCTFRPRPPSAGNSGDVNREITCTARNTKNNDHERQGTMILDLKYPPLLAPQISGYINGKPLYQGDPLTLTCAVAGGDPLVTSVTLTCPGHHDQGPNSGQSSSLVIPALSDADNNVTCVCSGQWARPQFYTTTSSVTLTVYSPVRSVRLTLNSVTGTLQVQEDQPTDVLFQCTAQGTPPPSLILSNDQGRELANLQGDTADGSVHESVLPHTVAGARCEDSAVYTCTADNGVGSALSSNATLRVLCNMRVIENSFESMDGAVPNLYIRDHGGEMKFQMLTTESPRSASFLHLGDSATGLGKPPKLGLLSVRCDAATAAYKSDCIIKAANVSQDAFGYYNVTLATTTDSSTFTFRLRKHQEHPEKVFGESGLGFGEGVGTGLGIGLFLVLLCVCGGAVWLRRRQWRLPCGSEHESQQSKKEREQPSEPALELTCSNPVMNEAGPYEELRQSEIGLRSVYQDIQPGTRDV